MAEAGEHCRYHFSDTVVKEGGHLRNKHSYSSPQRLNCHLQTYVVLNTVSFVRYFCLMVYCIFLIIYCINMHYVQCIVLQVISFCTGIVEFSVLCGNVTWCHCVLSFQCFESHWSRHQGLK